MGNIFDTLTEFDLGHKPRCPGQSCKEKLCAAHNTGGKKNLLFIVFIHQMECR